MFIKKKINFIFIVLIIIFSISTGLWSQNNCLDFDGTDDYIRSIEIGTISNKTLSAWVRLDDVNQMGSGLVTIESPGVGVGVNFDSITYNETSQGWGFGSHAFARTAWSGVTETTNNQWVHIAATWEDNSYKLYRNGELILETTSFAVYDFPSDTRIFIGVRCWSVNGFLDGQIDEVRVWDHVRTQSQIQNDMTGELVGNESGLIAYYQMSDGSGTSLTDDSSNSNTGTFYGGVNWHTLNQTQPTVSTVAASNVGSFSATSGCTVSGTDNWIYTGGVCWNTTGSPTITDDRTIDGGGSGTFSSSLTGLAGLTTFYARAYSTNNSGTTIYGNEINFTTTAQTNGDWQTQRLTLYNTTETDIMVRAGDIDNMGCGWPNGFDPFSGRSTPPHAYPYPLEVEDVTGTDTIFRPSSYNGSPPHGGDGYLGHGIDPEAVSMTYDLQGTNVESIAIQMFVDDFQAPVFWGNWNATIDGVSAPFLNRIINSLTQTGPIGKIITAQIPANFIQYFRDGSVQIMVDDTTTGAGDGYAIDFIKLLFNVKGFTYNGTVQGTVTSGGTGITGALITATGVFDHSENSGGDYQLTGVPAGMVLIEVSKTGYVSQSRVVDLIEGTTSTQNFVLVVDTSLIDISFTDGSSFTPAVSRGQNNQAIGRFQLSGASTGALLSGIDIQLNGIRTGISNIKIWQSNDSTFNASSDTQLGFTTFTDPGNGNSANFTGLSTSIPDTESYFFVTCDISASATGQITGLVQSYDNIYLSSGVFSGTITNAPLSNGNTPITQSPVVTTQAVSDIGMMTATGNGNLTTVGIPSPTAHGICWSTTSPPTTSDGVSNEGSINTIRSFTSSITGLSAGITYYVRAYATNSEGTFYGDTVNFTTDQTIPSLTTNVMSGITSTTATSGGNISSNGGASVIARGVCWSTSSNPTISGSNSTDGTGIGTFTSSITGLTPTVTYYVRAYATNSIGTAYGYVITISGILSRVVNFIILP